MSYRVWRDDETEDDGKTYPRTPDSDTAMPWTWALDDENAAELYAEWCHNQRDGWEWSWPVVFVVKNMETGAIAKFEVERETVPEFHGRQIK